MSESSKSVLIENISKLNAECVGGDGTYQTNARHAQQGVGPTDQAEEESKITTALQSSDLADSEGHCCLDLVALFYYNCGRVGAGSESICAGDVEKIDNAGGMDSTH